MIYRGKDIEDMTDEELANANFDLTYDIANRDNRLLSVKKRHKGIDFTKINPAFVELTIKIKTELELRKARS